MLSIWCRILRDENRIFKHRNNKRTFIWETSLNHQPYHFILIAIITKLWPVNWWRFMQDWKLWINSNLLFFAWISWWSMVWLFTLGATSIEKIPESSASGRNFLGPTPMLKFGLKQIIIIRFFQISLFQQKAEPHCTDDVNWVGPLEVADLITNPFYDTLNDSLWHLWG